MLPRFVLQETFFFFSSLLICCSNSHWVGVTWWGGGGGGGGLLAEVWAHMHVCVSAVYLFIYFFCFFKYKCDIAAASARKEQEAAEMISVYNCLFSSLAVIGHLPQRSSLLSLMWFIFQGKRHCYLRSGPPAGRRRIELLSMNCEIHIDIRRRLKKARGSNLQYYL